MHEGERGIQLKIPLQKKLAEIREYSDTLLVDHTTKILQLHVSTFISAFFLCFVVSVVERICICDLIRLSEQVSLDTTRLTLMFFHTGQQISELNCKAEKEKDKKRAEVKKHQKFKVGQENFGCLSLIHMQEISWIITLEGSIRE
ncbi:hypothetical protein Goari_013565 [Gossypium aridum]|uniref:Uncharacterized protein n=1 Tax=Gossypium aridum TaxID=34290 RepID=A0A7J8XF39_GOSAI|nr:hypothetical protein [Gossypium aridum]